MYHSSIKPNRPSGSKGLFIATADLKDAFYHFQLPEALSPYFRMRRVSAGPLGVESLRGRRLKASDFHYPRLNVLIGWCHALRWCHGLKLPAGQGRCTAAGGYAS